MLKTQTLYQQPSEIKQVLKDQFAMNNFNSDVFLLSSTYYLSNYIINTKQKEGNVQTIKVSWTPNTDFKGLMG